MNTYITTIDIKQLGLIIHSLNQSTDDYIFYWNLDDDIIHFSETVLNTFGFPGYEFKNALNEINKCVFRDDLEIFNWQMIMLKVGSINDIDIEIRLVSKEHNTTWISFRGRIESNLDSEKRYLFGRISLIGNKRKADDISGLHTEERCQSDFVVKTTDENFAGGFFLKLGIDNFKDINEKYGTATGDIVLKNLSDAIKDAVGDEAEVYRFDGDHFMIASYLDKPVHYATKIYRDIRYNIDRQTVDSGYKTFFTVSGGIVTFPLFGSEYEQLQKRCDFALNQAKRNGKNCWYIYNEEDYITHIKRLDMLAKLRDDINNEFAGFEVFYQPIVDYENGRLKGAEALLRWTSKESGYVSPALFIPILEESGLIIPVGKFVTYTAIKQCKMWQSIYPGFTININLSFIQIRKSDIVSEVIDFIEDVNINPNLITFEFTESGFIEDDFQVQRLITAFREKGITLALDDFGTGYSNLVYLQKMKVDTIKLDRSFVSKAINNEYYFKLISNIVNMAHNIDLKVCLEGIETNEEMEKVKIMVPDYIQGFYYGKPVCADDFYLQNFKIQNQKILVAE